MNFEEPKESFVWPPKAMLSLVHLGPKWFVRLIPTEDGLWWEIGGQRTEKYGSDADDSLYVDASGIHENQVPEDYVHFGLWNEGFAVDKRQTRIYYRFNTTMQKHECRIILPSDFHFRKSRKGKKLKDSKSFMEDGMPRPEVLLLYGLKTQELIDRRIAVEALPEKIWNAQDLGELFGAMDKVSMSHQNFCAFAGDWLSRAATCPGGLADWATWEKVADAAVAARMDTTLGVVTLDKDDIHAHFLKFLKECVEEHRGMPAQVHVRNKFNWGSTLDEQISNRWEALLITMGMTWLPGEPEWNKFHNQVKVNELDHVTHMPEKTNRRKVKSPKTRR